MECLILLTFSLIRNLSWFLRLFGIHVFCIYQISRSPYNWNPRATVPSAYLEPPCQLKESYSTFMLSSTKVTGETINISKSTQSNN
ncbi:hypothetical protein L1887_25448 [Cichorium endivia]|nr:hypothetical protein L1887_25448 [Cichorium endivia]